MATVEILAVPVLIASIVAMPLVIKVPLLVTAAGVVAVVMVVGAARVSQRQCIIDTVAVG